MKLLPVITILILAFFNTGCFGYRRGVFSMPYIADRPPLFASAATPFEMYQMGRVQLSNMVLRVDLMDSIKTSDTAWMCVIPLRINLKETHMYSSNWVVSGTIKATIEGVTFDASKILITVNGITHQVTAVNGQVTMPATHMWPSGSITLKPGKWSQFYIMLDRDTPDPNEDIQLDLNQAVKQPDGTIFPVIRFRKTRWTSPYS